MTEITYTSHLENVAWETLKADLRADRFDNGRSPAQLQKSFENSFAVCLAWSDGRVVGTARVLSDGVCNAYLVDVWTATPWRRQGVASQMLRLLLARLPGQHVCLFTDDARALYEKLGFRPDTTGMEQVVGAWLANDTACSASP